MSLKALSRFAIASAFVFAIGACSDSGSGGPDFDGEATSDETFEAGMGAGEMLADMMYTLNFGSPDIFVATAASARRFTASHPEFGGGLAPRLLDRGPAAPGLSATRGTGLQFVAAPGCSIVSSGTEGDPFDYYDGNGNSIPDDWHVKVVCVMQDSTDPANVTTITQTEEVTVKENSAAIYGYSAKSLFSIKVTDEEGSSAGIQFEGSDVLDIRADRINDHYKFTARGWETTEEGLLEEQGGEERTAAFDPTGTITIESALPDGELTLNGRQWFAATDDLSLSFTLETTEPLEYESACFDVTDPPFSDGTLVGHLNGNANSATFTLAFSDCGDFTVTVDNTSDEPVVVTRGRPAQRMLALRRD